MAKRIILLLAGLLVFSFISLSEGDKSLEDSFILYVKSDELKQDYIETALGQMYGIMSQRGKVFDDNMTADKINQEIASVLSSNFDQLKIEVKDSKLNKNGEMELTVIIEGKDVFIPLETNIVGSTSQKIINPEKFSKDFFRYMRMYSPGKNKIKVFYTLTDNEWQLTEENSTRLLGALLLVKYFDD